MNQDWIKHPKLASIDDAKLQMLNTLANQGAQKGKQDLMPFLMMAMKQSRQSGMNFSSQERDLIIEVLKSGKSPEELAKIEKMMQIMKMMT